MWPFNKLKKTAVKLENVLKGMVTMGTYELTHELTRSLTAATDTNNKIMVTSCTTCKYWIKGLLRDLPTISNI